MTRNIEFGLPIPDEESMGFVVPDINPISLSKRKPGVVGLLLGTHPETVASNRHGRIEARTATTADGLRYDVFTGVPKMPITRLSGVSSPAWFTAIDDGHNMRTQKRMLAAGIPWNFVSIERNPLHRMDMTKSASNLLDIHLAAALEYGHDTENVLLSGVSQGAMKALGAGAIAPYRGLNVIHIEAIAPCCAEETPLLPNKEQAKEVLAAEQESIRLLFAMKKAILLRYPGTLDKSLVNITNSILNQSELRTGKAGLYAAALPLSQQGHHVYPKGDIWLGQGEVFAEILSDHKNMTSEGVEVGGHLGCVVDEVSDKHRDRVVAVVNNFEAHTPAA